MFAAKLIQMPLKASISVPVQVFMTRASPKQLQLKSTFRVFIQTQRYASQSRLGARRAAERTKTKSLKEMAQEPASGSAIIGGRGLLAGASAVGIGALCYYGLGMSNEVGALEKAAIWPQYVRDRLRSTYLYFGAGLGMTALSAVAIARSPAIMARMMSNSWLAIGATFAAVIGSGILCRSIPYTEGFGAKHLAWMLHSGIVGAVIAPLTFLGGPILVKAAWYTAGVVGGLSMVAACAPSDKFLYMGGPLAMGLGVVFIASLGGMFFPPTTALGSGLYAISVYGGVVLFGGFLLYDTQHIVRKAETHPVVAGYPFDPINAAMGIYMDTINIFIRIAMILSGSGRKRK
ncbi:growth hormone-inducible transmembrane protein-like [Saccoglossus kowalevskii]|uniref:Growth hormone-inducible transmembrane protein-like n=1 Tax=Saccoglossus kowalevskii TaxID=10224 RepID=A0ABM0GQF7_SACKO|nr:PREDICTED: growth hormone-inducible transmembrane protein-like [Saccoglossus kowalevskii]